MDNKNLKYFLLIAIIPIISILFIFGYGVFYVKKEIHFAKKELIGLYQIYHIQYVIFNIQKIRGLSNIDNKNQKTINAINMLKEDTNQYIDKNLLNSDLGIYNEVVRKNFLTILSSIKNRDVKNLDFNQFSKIVENSTLLIGHISNYSNLSLDSKLKSYIMINSIISILPSTIEYTGQIRGISSSIVNNTLSKDKRDKILIQLSKIYENQKKLEENMNILKETENFTDIMTIYNDVKIAKNNIIEFTNNEILKKQKIMLNPNDIFAFSSNNTDHIVHLYTSIAEELGQTLKRRISEKKNIVIYLILIGIFSCIFIAYINRLFYTKNRKFIQKIEELTIKDAMTSLYNRRHFDKEFEKQLKIQKRAKENLIFIILDVDFFKQYNDTYGHHAGDKALISIANTLKTSLNRASDMAFRIGGEEFGILCSNMDEPKALKFANQIKQYVEDIKIIHEKNSTSQYITISLGLIIVEPSCDCSVDDLYKAADTALYDAKDNGRNRVSVGIC